MVDSKQTEKEITKYLDTLNPTAFEIISKLRAILKNSLPGAVESVSYGVLSFFDKKHFLYYAGFKGHIGIYPPLTTNKALMNKTKKYRNVKGNLIFKFKDDIPYDLIIEIAQALRKQYAK